MRFTRGGGGEDWTEMTFSDWMDVTPADWLDMRPADWMDQAVSTWNRTYERLLGARPADVLEGRYGFAPASRRRRYALKGRHGRPDRHRRKHRSRCGCEECDRHCHCRACAPDRCECFCCIGDVDFAVYTRVGERRVIPIEVENERRREKSIEVELSDWHTRGGDAAPVKTVYLDPEKFDLPPCGQQRITLAVEAHESVDEAEKKTTRRKKPGDVDRCLVAMADLRLVGCDHRPIRIAIAILPRDCDPHQVTCGCDCC